MSRTSGPVQPLEGSLSYWAEICALTGQGGLIDREGGPAGTYWWVYEHPTHLVVGPFRTGRAAFLAARRWLCPTAGPWRHPTPGWVFRAPGWPYYESDLEWG